MSEIIALNFKNDFSPEMNSRRVGELGEKIAAEFLIRNKFRLIVANFKVPVGRNRRGALVTGEIDLIALEADVLCFIEVKTRSSDEFASPLAAVDLRKQRQITRTARIYRKVFNLSGVKYRFDVVSIVLKKDAAPQIELFRNFWNESKFRKSFWFEDYAEKFR